MVADGYVGYELLQKFQWVLKPTSVSMLAPNELVSQ
jgi:hypothetical protein